MNNAPSFLEPVLAFFTVDPTLRIAQTLLLGGASLLIFLVLFTLRDILLRTHSLAYQIFSILLVACLPVLGFLIYLLIRPARTIKERELEKMLHSLVPQKMKKETEDTKETKETKEKN